MINERGSWVFGRYFRTRGRFFFVFVLLLVDIVLYPYATRRDSVEVWFQLLNGMITVACVYAVSFTRRMWIVALIIGIPVGLHRALVYQISANPWDLAGASLTVVFDILITVMIFERAFTAKDVTADSVFAAVSVYLLMGHLFANLFGILVALQPGAFFMTPGLNLRLVPGAPDMVYYSFATMTSLGAVGISPVSDQARSLSIIESVLGILYLGVLVARLITIYKPKVEAGVRT